MGLDKLTDLFQSTFHYQPKYYAAAPGRTEIGGNHTDHQHGKVLAAAVNLTTEAVISENQDHVIRVLSEGYPMATISLDDLIPNPKEKGTTASLIRGIAARFQNMGYLLGGFDAVCTSTVLPGSGLSSSAAFEVLIGTILNYLYADNQVSRVEIAKISQYAENMYFGKPCGLMDQMASSVGSVISIDFENPDLPLIQKIDVDFNACGYAICIVDSGADHANLTDEYAAIPEEMHAVAKLFGKEFLRDVSEDEFYSMLNLVREVCGDRAALRAMHFFAENKRVDFEVEALKQNDIATFLRVVRDSGRSSWNLLQNVVPTGEVKHQNMAIALALAERILGDKGAFRVHGGGFAGTIQAFVPNDMLSKFKSEMEAALGSGAVHVLNVRLSGGEICSL